MKQLLLSATILLVTAFSASAQCTADPQYTTPGVYPDSATGLPAAIAGTPYNETITIIVPLDTTLMIGPIPFTLDFDSVVVSDWQGLPPGFSIACNSPQNTTSPTDQCAFEGNTTGCIAITGNPVEADTGSYQQIITTQAYTTPNSPLGEPTETIVDYYYIHILSGSSAGVATLSQSKFALFPNPAQDVVTLNGLNDVDVSSVTVSDLNGKIFDTFTTFQGAALDINVDRLESGVYFIRINYDGTSETLKFIKE
jgi:hypothetical protein